MESCGSGLWTAPASSIHAIFPSTSFRRRCTSNRSRLTARPMKWLPLQIPRCACPRLVRDLQIDYTGLSLVAPEKVRFRYKLEGWDRDWQDADNRRQVFYTNLSPRDYRFRVKACNNSGVWNEAGASLDFSVAPAYYQNFWFRLSCGVAFLALLGGIYRLRLHQLARQYDIRLEERTRAEKRFRALL